MVFRVLAMKLTGIVKIAFEQAKMITNMSGFTVSKRLWRHIVLMFKEAQEQYVIIVLK